MIVTHYNPWLARGNAHARHALNHYFHTSTHADVSKSAVSTEAQGFAPRVDIQEEASRFVILADLPGVDIADIEIQMDKGTLSLKGERKAISAVDGVTSTRVERAHGPFDRRFALPDSADAEGITAIGRNGVVEISIPKKPETTPRRIAING
ncbi:MAG: Hsp20/alpha crystallin family protein [Dokdonella sp.]|uniref:Hsp20/alpha crystallin family protein n=1 Tax=Dokdonella sp. TaxID=2291710 RepID=UPI0032644309